MEYPTIEQLIGGTPLVRLQRLPGNTSNRVLVKLEGNTGIQGLLASSQYHRV